MILMSPFFGGSEYYIQSIRARGIQASISLIHLKSKPLRAIRRIHFNSPLPLKQLWFGEWKRTVHEYDLIIIHAADLMLPVARFLRKKQSSGRVVLWYWNSSDARSNPTRAIEEGFEVWSFDSIDCERFGLKLNSTYSFAEISEVASRIKPTVDFAFYGSDKGRAGRLVDLAKRLDALGFTHKFLVVGLTAQFPEGNGVVPAASTDYLGMLEHSASARVVVDLYQEGQTGLTLRALEALYLGRKLITDNPSIVSTPAYDPQMVFVIGVNEWNLLPDFLANTPNSNLRSAREFYDFDSWFLRIVEDRSLN